MSPSKTIRRLEVTSPVPADIDIANSVQSLDISEIAESLGLKPEHYDLYGKHKAKVLPLLESFFFSNCIFCSSLLIWD